MNSETYKKEYASPLCEVLILAESAIICDSPGGGFDDLEIGDYEWDNQQ